MQQQSRRTDPRITGKYLPISLAGPAFLPLILASYRGKFERKKLAIRFS
jgi:hypothetical protein